MIANAVTDVKPDASLSLYQLPGKWVSQDNRVISLSALQGKTVVAAMIFTHCGYACPRMVDNMRAIEDHLSGQVKTNTIFLLVSFDTERDTTRQLKSFASVKQLDDHWLLLHGAPDQVRELSMLLNIQYEKLPGGNFNHSNMITILDRRGVIIKQEKGLEPDVEAVAKIISLSSCR